MVSTDGIKFLSGDLVLRLKKRAACSSDQSWPKGEVWRKSLKMAIYLESVHNLITEKKTRWLLHTTTWKMSDCNVAVHISTVCMLRKLSRFKTRKGVNENISVKQNSILSKLNIRSSCMLQGKPVKIVSMQGRLRS